MAEGWADSLVDCMAELMADYLAAAMAVCWVVSMAENSVGLMADLRAAWTGAHWAARMAGWGLKRAVYLAVQLDFVTVEAKAVWKAD